MVAGGEADPQVSNEEVEQPNHHVMSHVGNLGIKDDIFQRVHLKLLQ